MAKLKDIFKIVFGLQLLVCTLATYGHPDAELIDFGSPTQPSRDQMMIEAAIKRGMDGEAVAELLRTKQPVVRTTTTPTGFTKTTTYKLEPDGSISSKSILKKREHYTYNTHTIPDDLKNSPTGTVTKTFTDSEGNKVTQTFTVNHENPASRLDTHNLGSDWLNKAFPSWPQEASSSPSYSSTRRTVTRTFGTPNGERRTVQSWSTDPEFSQPNSSFGTNNNTPNYNRRTTIRTYTNPSEGKRILQTTSTKPEDFEPTFPGIDDINWPNWDDADTDDFNGWEVENDPEVTTKNNFESWTPKTWNWPEFPTPRTTTTTTTTAIPNLYLEPEPSNRKPLPSLDDFLKTQYAQKPNRESATSTAKTSTRSDTTTTPKYSSSTPKVIQVEDLPVVEVLHNGKPADENILKTLPAHLTPRTQTEQVIHIEHKHPIEQDIEEDYSSKSDTNIRSYSTTHIGPEKPRLKDLNPQMQDILRNAGIVPEIEGDTITKTRTEPDGRVITTTYKVNSVPSAPNNYAPAMPPLYAPSQMSTHAFNSYHPRVPLAALTPNYGPISKFLAQLGLTKFDIISRNSHYSKTFIDENGDVLTATFVLTSGKNNGSEANAKAKPYK